MMKSAGWLSLAILIAYGFAVVAPLLRHRLTSHQPTLSPARPGHETALRLPRQPLTWASRSVLLS